MVAGRAIFGVEMQLAQSSVGKTLLSRIILPPMLGSFSTSRTLKPMSPRVSGGLHAGDAGAYDECVVIHVRLPSPTAQKAAPAPACVAPR